MNKKLLASGAVAAFLLIGGVFHDAIGQAVQWSYGFINNQATATYPGNVVVSGTITGTYSGSIPIGNVTGLGTGVATLLGGNSTGTGGPVGNTSPSLSGLTLSDVTGSIQCLQANSSGLISGAGGCAVTGPVWSLSRSAAQTGLTTTAAVIQWDTKDFDPSTVCLITTPWTCTPNKVGYYSLTCQAYVSATTGPVVGAGLITVSLRKNGTVIKTNVVFAQAASISGPSVMGTVTANIQSSSTSDTFDCVVASNSTGGQVNGNIIDTFFTGIFEHP